MIRFNEQIMRPKLSIICRIILPSSRPETNQLICLELPFIKWGDVSSVFHTNIIYKYRFLLNQRFGINRIVIQQQFSSFATSKDDGCHFKCRLNQKRNSITMAANEHKAMPNYSVVRYLRTHIV